MSDFLENKDFHKGLLISTRMYYYIIRDTRYSVFGIKRLLQLVVLRIHYRGVTLSGFCPELLRKEGLRIGQYRGKDKRDKA